MRFKESNDYFESQNSEASSENNAAIYSTQMQDCLDSFHIFSQETNLRTFTFTSNDLLCLYYAENQTNDIYHDQHFKKLGHGGKPGDFLVH